MPEIMESTIVMVDDNVDEIFLARRTMRQEGVLNRFVSVKNPANLFETLDELVTMGVSKKSFVILVDVNMPQINGFEMVTAIRNHPSYRFAPIFMLSASDDLSDLLEADELGCDGFLKKPFSSDEFLNQLRKVSTLKSKIFCCPDPERGAVQKTESLAA